MEGCPKGLPSCIYPVMPRCPDRHHTYWPSTDYTSTAEREFRDLPENIEVKFVCDHRELHRDTDPPPKPALEFMREAIQKALASGQIRLSRAKGRKIFNN